jgi:hypothetical protein
MTCRILVLMIVASLGTAAQAQRPASAPALVPVRLDTEGSFRIAPPYVADPAFTEKPNVPKGRVIRFTMNSAESGIFPVEQMRNWVLANKPDDRRVESEALPAPVRSLRSVGARRSARAASDAARSLEWVWKGYQPAR